MEKLPIIFFSQREIDELRVEGGSSSEKPKWVLTGATLQNRADSLYKDYSVFADCFEKRKQSIIPFVFKAKVDDDATSKTRRKDILSLFEMNKSNNVLGITSSNELLVNIKDSVEMEELGNRLKKIADYENAISCLENFTIFKPSVEYNKDEDIYKIKLIDYIDYETNVSIQRVFEQELKKRNIEYKKNYYTNKLVIYSVRKVAKATIDSFVSDSEFDMIFSIEPMPRYSVTLDSLDNIQSTIPVL